MTTLTPSQLDQRESNQFVVRSNVGNLGRPFKIKTNFYEIEKLPDIGIYQYLSSLQ
jgi:hypothetical protein